MKTLHLNLLNPLERRSASPVRARVMLPFLAGFVLLFMLVWCGFLGVQKLLIGSRSATVRQAIAAKAGDSAAVDAFRQKLALQQAEADQYLYYMHARERRGNVFRMLAYAVPEGVTLSDLEILPPPAQNLKRPIGSKLPPLQGPTQTVERVTLRIAGRAHDEQDVIALMNALEGASFTGLVSIVKHPKPGEAQSPRVLSFKQEAPPNQPNQPSHRDIVFDLAYDLKPREFVK